MMFVERLFKKRPHIICITIDMFRRDHIGLYPVFDALKARGAFFSNMITYAPYTIASMHAIFSGIYGHRNGVDGYYKSEKFEHEKCRTLTQYLQDCGYHTVGDANSKLIIPQYGFDEFSAHDETQDDLLRCHQAIIEKALARKRRVFAYLHYSFIHRNIVANVIKAFADYDQHYFSHQDENRKRYESYTAAAAKYLAGMLEYYARRLADDNTLLVIQTDHGCGLGERPGEKAYGIFTYDYTIKTWAGFIYAGKIPPATEIIGQMRSVDIMPTILELADINPNRKFMALDGVSLLPVIRGNERGDRDAFAETGGVDGPHPSPYEANVKCIRTGEWKLIYNLTTKQKELYNLRRDPDELDNLIGRESQIESELWKKLVSI